MRERYENDIIYELKCTQCMQCKQTMYQITDYSH